MRHAAALRFVDAVARAGSIRRAAETLAITSTALNRRILTLEEELGAPIFERLPRGVRLTTAGELFVHHARRQLAELERVRSQISDLSGERRGRVAIASSQGLLPFFLPAQIARYRVRHPAVMFRVARRDRDAAERALADYSADIALIFEPVRFGDFHVVASARQRLQVVMRAGHPLAGRQTVRLSDCLDWPIALPTAEYGVRHLLDLAQTRSLIRLHPVVESDSFEFLRGLPSAEEGLISFQIGLGLPDPATMAAMRLAATPLDVRDAPEGVVHLGQLRGRTLPVAAARFLDQVERAITLSDG